MKNLEKFLEKLGCSTGEIEVYEALLLNGSMTILELSRLIDVNRATIYKLIDNLKQKKIVEEVKYGQRKKFLAVSPVNLRKLLDDKYRKVVRLDRLYTDALNDYYSKTSLDKGISEKIVLVYRGKKKFLEVCDRSLEFADKDILFLSNIDEWYKVYSKEYDEKHYIPQRLKKSIKLKLLVKKSSFSKKMKSKDKSLLRETRFFSNKYLINSTIIVYGKEVAMMVSDSPYTAVVIKNKVFADTMRVFFQIVWDNSK